MKDNIRKIITFVNKKFWFLNPIGVISRLYINSINKKEYKNPPFAIFNERPIEYGFVFEQISKQYPKKILDIGTGLTSLPHLMANCGCAVTAIDNIKDYWSYDLFNRHYYVINDSIVEPKINEKFDLITCISTLEHIENYNKAVESIFSLLNPGGYLILTFPYNEKKYTDNVYAVEGSNAKILPTYKTHAFSRKEIDNWCKDKAKIINQEYWQFFDGEYWTVGKKLDIPKKVNAEEKHQISCVLFQKN
jgi:2-polyprenyl-3-methyl-5-hydroxy-6-metoxy-1,4-benzoquinol methylase